MRPIDAERLKAVLEKNFGHTGGASVLEQLIDEQPTIEPSTNCSEIPNSSDTISRQAAIDELGYCQTYLFDSRDKDKKISLEDAEYAIEQLPSAQPEPHEGHWIEGKIYRDVIECNCSECGQLMTTAASVRMSFCPNCGARMTR